MRHYWFLGIISQHEGGACRRVRYARSLFHTCKSEVYDDDSASPHAPRKRSVSVDWIQHERITCLTSQRHMARHIIGSSTIECHIICHVSKCDTRPSGQHEHSLALGIFQITFPQFWDHLVFIFRLWVANFEYLGIPDPTVRFVFHDEALKQKWLLSGALFGCLEAIELRGAWSSEQGDILSSHIPVLEVLNSSLSNDTGAC